jgi:hypothetical protein
MTSAVSVEPFKNRIIIVRMSSQRREKADEKKKRSQSDKIWHWALTSFAVEIWGGNRFE